jgi:hypothetical protein
MVDQALLQRVVEDVVIGNPYCSAVVLVEGQLRPLERQELEGKVVRVVVAVAAVQEQQVVRAVMVAMG